MTEGKRVTLDELFKEKEAEMRLRIQTPEWKAMEERSSEKFKREEAGRLKWEAENPRTQFDIGSDAALRGEDREAPEDLEEAARLEWLDGYDSEAPDDDEDE